MNINQNIDKKNICVLGLGHVGLTLSLVMAEKGLNVIGFDTNQKLIEQINSKQSPILEPNIDHYLDKLLGKTFKATSSLSNFSADVYIITVGTPIDSDKNLNISFIKRAAESIGNKIKYGDLVILRSTVPVGLSRNIVAPILEEKSKLKCGKDFLLSYSPERTIEGEALKELSELPQIVSGFNKESSKYAKKIFSKITLDVEEVGSLENAEMIKIMNNTFRDVKFAYANEMALICKDLGLDMVDLVKFANAGYKRDRIPVPSPGVGGACLSKDTYILKYSAKDIFHKPKLSLKARETNELIPLEILNSIEKTLKQNNKSIEQAKFFIIGFAFKGNPETADLRGSTTIDFLSELNKKISKDKIVYGFDPIVNPDEIRNLKVEYTNYVNGFDQADVVLFMNNHLSYKELDIQKLLKSASNDCIFYDAWHLFEPAKISLINKVIYQSVGYGI